MRQKEILDAIEKKQQELKQNFSKFNLSVKEFDMKPGIKISDEIGELWQKYEEAVYQEAINKKEELEELFTDFVFLVRKTGIKESGRIIKTDSSDLSKIINGKKHISYNKLLALITGLLEKEKAR